MPKLPVILFEDEFHWMTGNSQIPTRLPVTLRALRHRNYKLFISGQIISQVGWWMQSTAQSWLVFPILTKDSSLLGIVGFASMVPILALGLFAGAVADAVNRHKLIITMQILLMLQAITIGILTLLRQDDGTPVITYTLVLLLATMTGIFQAFDVPARQAFLHQMVPKDDLQNAIALNSLAFNTARIVGPSIAGFLIWRLSKIRPDHVSFGEAICFFINAASFMAVLVSLLRIRATPQTIKPFHGSTARFMAEGLRYIKGQRHIRDLMIFIGMMAVFGIPYLMLIQVFATEALKGSSRTFGTLMTCVGIGATAGGLLLARRKHIQDLGKVIVSVIGGFGITLIAFAWSNHFIVACALIGLCGFFMVITMISSMTLVQYLIAEHVRGRVMSIYNMVSTGFMPFGMLISGSLAKGLGVRLALTINAMICLTAAAWFLTRLSRLNSAIAQMKTME